MLSISHRIELCLSLHVSIDCCRLHFMISWAFDVDNNFYMYTKTQSTSLIPPLLLRCKSKNKTLEKALIQCRICIFLYRCWMSLFFFLFNSVLRICLVINAWCIWLFFSKFKVLLFTVTFHSKRERVNILVLLLIINSIFSKLRISTLHRWYDAGQFTCTYFSICL